MRCGLAGKRDDWSELIHGAWYWIEGEGVRVAIRVVLMMTRGRSQGEREGYGRRRMVIKQDIRQYVGAIYKLAP